MRLHAGRARPHRRGRASGAGARRCSGFVTTGHELGAAFGVAVISAVATAASTFIDGYANGFLAVAAAAAVVGVIALLATPTVRPDMEAQAATDG